MPALSTRCGAPQTLLGPTPRAPSVVAVFSRCLSWDQQPHTWTITPWFILEQPVAFPLHSPPFLDPISHPLLSVGTFPLVLAFLGRGAACSCVTGYTPATQTSPDITTSDP